MIEDRERTGEVHALPEGAARLQAAVGGQTPVVQIAGKLPRDNPLLIGGVAAEIAGTVPRAGTGEARVATVEMEVLEEISEKIGPRLRRCLR